MMKDKEKKKANNIDSSGSLSVRTKCAKFIGGVRAVVELLYFAVAVVAGAS